MGSKICMNASCGATITKDWKKGWPLRSGEFAHLCHKCGSAYENLFFCDTFHLEENGWRNCRFCGKRIHCGCIASMSLFQCLDYGGVGCTNCIKGSQIRMIQRGEVPKGFGALTISNIGDLQSSPVQNRVNNASIDEERLLQLCKIMEASESSLLPLPQRVDTSASLGQTKNNKRTSLFGEAGKGYSNVIQPSLRSLSYAKTESSVLFLEVKDGNESLAQPSLTMALGAMSGTPNSAMAFSGGAVEVREQSKLPSYFQQSQKSRPILPKPLKTGLASSPETGNMISQMRIARPPAEGRGKNQLLPRYWPRITDQELEKLSGDLKSTIVPLFEKVLSASDAGRIGRLVLPKACAEAYFPPISQSEGLPIRIQDVKGNEWTFQFRFWPNNNSRMYVLEGVTPCIQSMHLCAGDTVTFSRIDPGGKLVMGFRKAINSVDMQEAQTSGLANGSHSGEASFTGVINNFPIGADEDIDLHKSENDGGRTNGDSLQQAMPVVEKKKARNIFPKNKRLLMHSEEALELRLTWEEAQDLLRPPPRVKPSIVTIEDHEFEEYDEPPVFGKRTIFTARPSEGQEQWAQCDDCSKWRRLPMDVLLPSKWTCLNNAWDSSRCSCSASEEITPKELENLLRTSKDFKKRRTMENHRPSQEIDPSSGLDALASAAILGDDVSNDLQDPSVGATTKHPRHRQGCTCIVCIQPPSGKGKHKSTCTCNVCMTVKRRFKTLMLRKKKRQLENKGEMESERLRDASIMHMDQSENEGSQGRTQGEVGDNSSGQIDLNCDPDREDMQMEVAAGLSMIGLVQAASLPLDSYMKLNGLSNLICEQQASLESTSLPPSAGESEKRISDEGCPLSPLDLELENRIERHYDSGDPDSD